MEASRPRKRRIWPYLALLGILAFTIPQLLSAQHERTVRLTLRRLLGEDDRGYTKGPKGSVVAMRAADNQDYAKLTKDLDEARAMLYVHIARIVDRPEHHVMSERTAQERARAARLAFLIRATETLPLLENWDKALEQAMRRYDVPNATRQDQAYQLAALRLRTVVYTARQALSQTTETTPAATLPADFSDLPTFLRKP